MSPVVIGVDDPAAPDVHQLLATHLAWARSITPAEHVHALPPPALLDPAVTLYSARRDGELLGIGAIRQLEESHAELKSMHTRASARGRGIGRAILEHLLAVAAGRGCRRVSLETGTDAGFAPARSLYESAGFSPCEPFGEYTSNPYSLCMTLLAGDRRPHRENI